MKKVLKSRIFMIALTAIICITGTTYAATQILASNIAYKETTVDKALDDLYTKAKPEYTGSTTIIPSFNEQIFSTKDKIMTKNLKVEAIPSTYKNLTTTTTATANTILSGYKAYTSDGTLVTGNVSTDCVSGKFNSNDYSSSTDKLLVNFAPTQFIIYAKSGTWKGGHFYYSSYGSKFIDFDFINDDSSNGGLVTTNENLNKYYTINDGLYIHSWPSGFTLYYMACK